MMIIIYICTFLLGASLASYINATIYRIEKKTKYPDIFTQSSYCENCKKKLKWYELIPILGYVIISGKCSKCGEKINIYYPLSELLLGIGFLLFFMFSVPFYYWILLLFLFILSFHDILYRGVPKSLTHIFLLLCFLIFLFYNINISSIIAMVVVVGMLLILMAIMKNSFGMGDILLLLGVGIALGYRNFLTMFWLSIITSLLYSFIYMIVKKKKLKGVKIPMVPFFTVSFLFSVIYGEKIIDFILNRILL